MSFLNSFMPQSSRTLQIAPLVPLRRWLNTVEVRNVTIARWICRLVPNVCSPGYDVQLFGRTWLHLPPLCKLNPVFDELIDLRFRAGDFLYEYAEAQLQNGEPA